MRATWLVLILGHILHSTHGDALCHDNDTGLIVGSGSTIGHSTLSRRKRHLTFPTGSAFVVTLSLLKAIQITEPSNWNLDLEFDMIWPIPSQENLRKALRARRPSMVKRRHRRELYANVELALDSSGIPGRQCLLRTICEARSMLSSPGHSFVEDTLRAILSHSENSDEVDCYDDAYRMTEDCEIAYSCPFSLLQILLSTMYADDLDEK